MASCPRRELSPRSRAGVRGIDASQILEELARRPIASLRILLEGFVDEGRQRRGQRRVQRQRRGGPPVQELIENRRRCAALKRRSPGRHLEKNRLPERKGRCARRASFRAPVRETCSRPCRQSLPLLDISLAVVAPSGSHVESGLKNFATPKSRILTRSSSVIMTLAGFKSRCRTPAA